MSLPQASYSRDFRQFLQQVEASLVKSAAEARKIAEQTGTPLITGDVLKQRGYETLPPQQTDPEAKF
jgi:hypothetical protein